MSWSCGDHMVTFNMMYETSARMTFMKCCAIAIFFKVFLFFSFFFFFCFLHQAGFSLADDYETDSYY